MLQTQGKKKIWNPNIKPCLLALKISKQLKESKGASAHGDINSAINQTKVQSK